MYRSCYSQGEIFTISPQNQTGLPRKNGEARPGWYRKNKRMAKKKIRKIEMAASPIAKDYREGLSRADALDSQSIPCDWPPSGVGANRSPGLTALAVRPPPRNGGGFCACAAMPRNRAKRDAQTNAQRWFRNGCSASRAELYGRHQRQFIAVTKKERLRECNGFGKASTPKNHRTKALVFSASQAFSSSLRRGARVSYTRLW